MAHRQVYRRGLHRSPRSGHRSVVVPGGVPNIGQEAMYLADSFALADNTTITGSWATTYGATALGVLGTPKYRTGQALFNGQPYVEWGAATDGFAADIGTASQPFVIVSYEYINGAPSASGLMIDSYDDGVTLPTARCWWQYQDTVIDQTRMSAGTALAANWAFIGLSSEHLVESTYNGASSAQKSDGGADHITGNAGANGMQGLALIGYNNASAVNTRRCAFVMRISSANWTAGRTQFLSWFNAKYGRAIS